MPNYSITVKNRSGRTGEYSFFSEAPETNSGTVFTAPLSCELVEENESCDFRLSDNYYAVIASSRQKLGPNVQVSTSASIPVKLCRNGEPGSTCVVKGLGHGAATFDPHGNTQPCRMEGSFCIECTNLEPGGNGTIIGIGAQDPNDPSNIVPFALTEARPNTNICFTPKPRYYISAGRSHIGQTMDLGSLRDPTLIDFSGKGGTRAVATHQEDGRWSVNYM